jgi:hypothetical protein
MTSAPPDTESNLWPAVLLFSAVYLGVSALVTAILVGFDIDANSGVATGAPTAAPSNVASNCASRYWLSWRCWS